MKQFKINILTDRPEIIRDERSHIGEIVIGNFEEIFQIPLCFWRLIDYKKQWKSALEHIKTHDSSCFIVSIHATAKNLINDPDDLDLQLFILYKVGNKIFIQNRFFGWLRLRETRKIKKLPPFDAKSCYSYLPPRETVTPEGEKISEWSISVSDLKHAQVGGKY